MPKEYPNETRPSYVGSVPLPPSSGPFEAAYTAMNNMADILRALQGIEGALLGHSAEPCEANAVCVRPTQYGGLLGDLESCARNSEDNFTECSKIIHRLREAL